MLLLKYCYFIIFITQYLDLRKQCYRNGALLKVALYSFLAREAWVRMARAREYLKEK